MFSISKSEQTGAGAGRLWNVDSGDMETWRLYWAPLQKTEEISKTRISLRTITTFQKKKRKRTAKSNYSNTKVKARNLLTNVSYRRFKQKDFNNASFITDIFLFIVQYFTPINLDKKLNNEKGKFVSSIYKEVIRPVLNLFFFFLQ